MIQEVAKAQGIYAIRLEVAHTNTSAQRF
ncbi:MAG: hypothetical protein AAF821_21130 [Cyanobacteria bacterium P01_D01_bin.156]